MKGHKDKKRWVNMGVFTNLINDEGASVLGSLEFHELMFKCRYKECDHRMSYDQMLDSTYHDDCECRVYKCLRCNKEVKKGMIRYHKI